MGKRIKRRRGRGREKKEKESEVEKVNRKERYTVYIREAEGMYKER